MAKLSILSLVVSVIFCCQSFVACEVFYITPVESSPKTCPQPDSCLTLDQYVANYVHYTSASTTTMIFLPGIHILRMTLNVSNVESFSMISNISSTRIECKRGSYFYFNCRHLHIANVEFSGCGHNKVYGVGTFVLEGTTFMGNEDSGTAFEMSDTSARFIRSTFVSNRMGKVESIPPYVRKFYYSTYLLGSWNKASRGGAIIAVRSEINITQSLFESNRADLGAVLFMENCRIFINSTSFIDNDGGVVYATNSFITMGPDVIFEANTALFTGVLLSYKSDVTIEKGQFDSNSASAGAIILSQESNITLRLCILDNSFAYIEGGALMTENSNVTIVSCIFCNSSAINYGGLMSSTSDSITMINNTFILSSSYIGGAFSIRESTNTIIRHCSFDSSTSTGNGGVFFSLNSIIIIERCSLSANNANQGGVIYSGYANNLTMIDTNFIENSAAIGAVLYATQNSVVNFYGLTVISNNVATELAIVYFLASTGYFWSSSVFSENLGSLFAFNSNLYFLGSIEFRNNSAQLTNISLEEGGAITLFQSNLHYNGTTKLVHNTAENGGAVHSSESNIYINGLVIIAHNNARGNGGGLYFLNSELMCNEGSTTTLTDNTAKEKGGGIHAIGSFIKTILSYQNTDTYTGAKLNLTNNTASKGGGLSLEVNAKLYILKYGIVYPKIHVFSVAFTSNKAATGSDVFVDDQSNNGACESRQRAQCFFQILAVNLYKINDYPKSIYFSRPVHETGPIVYGGLLDRCMISPFAEAFYANEQYLEQGGTGLTNFMNSSTIVKDSISSSPVRVYICDYQYYTANCTQVQENDGAIKVKKGELFTISVVAVDQANHPVEAIIQSSLKHSESGLGEGQLSRGVNGTCTNLSFSITSPHDQEEISLYAIDGPCKDADLSKATVAVQFLPCSCPIGFQSSKYDQTNCICECNEDIAKYVKCDIQTEAFVRTSQANVWISYDNVSGYFVYPNSPFDYCKPISFQTPVNLNKRRGADAQCAFNRSGLLCGSCQSGLSLSIGSSLCLSCPSYWPALFISITLASFLAGIALVALLMILNMTVAVGTLNGLIFYANVVATYRSILLPFEQPNFITVFVSWLNLEIGIDSCFFEGMDTYSKTWLKLAFPAYVMGIVIMIIIISAYSTKFSHLIGRKDPVATLATLILLSYAKLIEVVFNILVYADLTYGDGSHNIVWLPDATVGYFSGKHTVLFIVAVVITLVGLVYTLLVFAWQWILLLPRWKILKWSTNTKLQTFVETHHSPYTARHRYWTGLLLVVRVILYLVAIANTSNDPHLALTSIAFIVTCLLVLKGFFGRIYKKWPVDVLETICYFNILLISLFTYYSLTDVNTNSNKAPAYISVISMFIALLIIMLYHLYAYTSLFEKLCCSNTKIKTNLDKLLKPDPLPKPKPQSTPYGNIDRFQQLMYTFDHTTNTNDCEVLSLEDPQKVTHSVVEAPKKTELYLSNTDC